MGCDRGLADTTLGTGHQHCLHALPPDRRNDPRGYTGPGTAATAQPRRLPAAVVYPLQGNRRHGAWSWKGVGVARSGAGEAPWDARDDRTAAGAPALRDERPDRARAGRGGPADRQIGRAQVRTPVTHAHIVCRILLEKKK